MDRVGGLSDGRESPLRRPLRESMDGVRRGVDEEVHGKNTGVGSTLLRNFSKFCKRLIKRRGYAD